MTDFINPNEETRVEKVQKGKLSYIFCFLKMA